MQRFLPLARFMTHAKSSPIYLVSETILDSTELLPIPVNWLEQNWFIMKAIMVFCHSILSLWCFYIFRYIWPQLWSLKILLICLDFQTICSLIGRSHKKHLMSCLLRYWSFRISCYPHISDIIHCNSLLKKWQFWHYPFSLPFDPHILVNQFGHWLQLPPERYHLLLATS